MKATLDSKAGTITVIHHAYNTDFFKEVTSFDEVDGQCFQHEDHTVAFNKCWTSVLNGYDYSCATWSNTEREGEQWECDVDFINE